MKNNVAPRQRFGPQVSVSDIAFQKQYILRHLRAPARREVINHHNFTIFRYEKIHEMGSDKSCAASDESFHCVSSLVG